VGVLVQTNFDGVLSIVGAPVGRELDRGYLRNQFGGGRRDSLAEDNEDGSIMIVMATDAPLDHRSLERLARRALAGLARTGSSMSNGSGDYVIAFATPQGADRPLVSNNGMSPLFQAVIEATEEAIYNSLFFATSVIGHRGSAEALPLAETIAILKRYGVITRER
jgi:D-aminopeptidase